MSASRFFILLALPVLFATSSPAFAANDTLPDFNAPIDNSPLNVDKVNKYFGVEMFKDPSLWGEDDIFVAKRLAWPPESRTMSQSSYRLYPTDKAPVNILGARAYSCVLYAEKGRPTEISIVFVNEGDYEWTKNVLKTAEQLKTPSDNSTTNAPPATTDASPSTNTAPSTSPDANPSLTNAPATNTDTTPSTNAAPAKPEDDATKLSKLNEDDLSRANQDVHEDFEKALKQDAQTITDALTKLFGDPQHMSFGGGSETSERVLRWDWQGHSFLLAKPKDTYVSLRIVPVAFANNYGKGDVIDRDELKATLLKRVKQFDSGDVVVSEIPMVDQGPKSYCVPATWERYLRFLGIPADMYVLATAAHSTAQGTNLDAMVENVDSLVTLYHRRIDNIPGDLSMDMISKNINQGLPIMITCFIHVPFEKAIIKRTVERRDITDWDAWTKELQTRDMTEIGNEIDGSPNAGSHQRMIIGYNTKTNEIAVSDSWSAAFAIRWMTLKEANAINAGQSYVIEP